MKINVNEHSPQIRPDEETNRNQNSHTRNRKHLHIILPYCGHLCQFNGGDGTINRTRLCLNKAFALSVLVSTLPEVSTQRYPSGWGQPPGPTVPSQPLHLPEGSTGKTTHIKHSGWSQWKKGPVFINYMMQWAIDYCVWDAEGDYNYVCKDYCEEDNSLKTGW